MVSHRNSQSSFLTKLNQEQPFASVLSLINITNEFCIQNILKNIIFKFSYICILSTYYVLSSHLDGRVKIDMYDLYMYVCVCMYVYTCIYTHVVCVCVCVCVCMCPVPSELTFLNCLYPPVAIPLPVVHGLCMYVKVAQSCPTLLPHGLQPTKLLYLLIFPGKNTRVGCHFLSSQGSARPGHCKQTLYNLSHQGSPVNGLRIPRNHESYRYFPVGMLHCFYQTHSVSEPSFFYCLLLSASLSSPDLL